MITAKIIADSIDPAGKRIITYELEYPRFIHAELMTHRLFSRNAASSRAIPINKMIDMVLTDPAMPIEWGKNQSGMQAKEVFTGWRAATATWAWKKASRVAVGSAKLLDSIGLHKQIVNRTLETFQNIKVVVTATEYDNWFWLRDHPDAQPEIQELARKMLISKTESTPQKLRIGEWHLPYVTFVRKMDGGYYEVNGQHVSLEDAIKISASCCAQVSYRTLNDTLAAAIRIYNQLVGMTPVHASPFEHQATPMRKPYSNLEDSVLDLFTEEGITHMDKDNNFWSGNFKGWIQNRQLIPNNACWNYTEHK